jgi:formate/nitrite transporter FocA (FNT family)
MFFLPAAMMVHTSPGIDAGHMVLNLVFAFLGNAVGAGLFVAGAYWFLYGRTVLAAEYIDATVAGRNGHRSPAPVR